MPTIAIIGASTDRSKFGNKAVRAYLKRKWTVLPIHPKEREIEGVAALASIDLVPKGVDRVSLYVPPAIGVTLLPKIAALGAKEVYVNPGAGSPELMAKARELGLAPLDACAIVAIGETPDRYV